MVKEIIAESGWALEMSVIIAGMGKPQADP